MTNDVLEQLEDSIASPMLGGEVSDELIAILRGDPDAKKDWERVKLSDVAEIVGGSTPSTKELEYWDGDIPWLTPKDLSNNKDKYVSTGERSITQLGIQNSGAKLLPKNSILFSSRAPIGYVAIAGGPIATNQGFKSLICNPEILDYQYAYYLMNQLKGPLEKVASGSTFLEVSGNVVKNFEIDLPPLHIQKQIADLLSVFDERIELLRAQNKTLESIAQAIYKRWFVDFEFPDENGNPYKSSGGKMKPSERGDIPKIWKRGVLSDLCEAVGRGISPTYSDKGILVLNQKCIRNRKIDFSLGRTHSTSEKEVPASKIIKKDDFLVNSTGVGTVGRTARARIISNISTVDTHVTIIRTKNFVPESWFDCLLANLESQIEESAEGSTGQVELKREKLNQIDVIVPTSEILAEYKKSMEVTDKRITLNELSIALVKGMKAHIARSIFIYSKETQ